MKDFKALIRDTQPINNPQGTWQHGKNMLLSKGYKSISNEDGFNFEYLISGTIVGVIVTNKDIIYFSKNEDGTDEIGVVNTDNVAPVYVTIIKSTLFTFQYNCPIEGIFIYNFKEELIIAWSDGVKTNSNTPKVINLTVPPLTLNGDGTLVDNNEFKKLSMFPEIKEADIAVDYLSSGNIDGFNAYITYAYVFDDGSSTVYFSENLLVYLAEGFPANRKGIRLTFSDLDTNFNKIKIGIVTNKTSELSGYESYPITYTGTDLVVDVTTLTHYTEASPENIILEKSVFTKINTMTKQENEVILGNVHINKDIPFQKYANLIELKPYRYLPNDIQVASLMPDEVYSMYIELQLLDSSYTSRFHIPGRIAISTETDVLTAQQITDFQLQWTVNYDTFKQFHVFNNGLVSATIATNSFGYWENVEKYPNTDDYNSTIDYNNAAIIGGSDLRDTPIRYHRMPSIKKVYDDTGDATEYKIGISVENFNSIVPQEVKDQIQGYRLCFVQRDGGNSYVAGNWVRTRRGAMSEHPSDIGEIDWEAYNFSNLGVPISVDFTRGRVLGNELFKFKPNLDLTYIKNNYVQGGVLGTQGTIENVIDADTFAEVNDANLRYVPGNNSATNVDKTGYGSLYLEEGVNLDVTDAAHLTITDLTGTKVSNITAFSHKANLYGGFKSSKFVTMGRTSKIDLPEIRFTGGDVFNDTEVDIVIHTVTKNADGTGDNTAVNVLYANLFSPVNSSKLTSEQEMDGTTVLYDTNNGDNVPVDILNTRIYEFTVDHEEDLSVINNLIVGLSFDTSDNFIDKFPYRIHRSIKIPNESISIESLKTFLVSSYYEMPNDKGEIIALRGKEKTLFIQHRFTLFVASIKDKLVTQNVDAYLGRTDLFDRPPTELLSEDKGYIGSTSKFACIVIKGMYITVNQVNGQIFIIKENIKEITAIGNKQWFWENWDTGLGFYETTVQGNKVRIDNPITSVGHLVGYDKEFDRLLFTKKSFKFIGDMTGVTFDGEFYTKNGSKLEFTDDTYFENLSRTISYSLTTNSWLFEHDYYPNMMFYTIDNLFSITNLLNGSTRASIYKHNDKTVKGFYYGTKYDSYVDLIFNQRSELSKLYKNIKWVTDVINSSKGNELFKTITSIMVYNNNQCSGIIDLKNEHFNLTRNVQGEWNFDDFRDLILDATNPIINDKGVLLDSNINNNKIWFDKSNFISKFIIVRLIVDNIDNDDVHIHQVDVSSIISNR